ncbi:MAG: DUF502 domain-containing protein [Candidatus Babeliales bacterium]
MDVKASLLAIGNWIKSIFLNGIMVLMPIILTIAIFRYVFSLTKRWLAPLVTYHLFQCCIPEWGRGIPYIEYLLVALIIFLIGLIFKLFFARALLDFVEQTFSKLPLISQLYFGIKQMVRALTAQDQLTFQQVVIMEFPRIGVYSIGFLTGQSPIHLHPKEGKNFYNVFIPTTPNPTSGFLVIAAEGDFTVVDLTRQEAMSLIISGGIIRPERFEKK